LAALLVAVALARHSKILYKRQGKRQPYKEVMDKRRPSMHIVGFALFFLLSPFSSCLSLKM
jgi:hypothetical protein